MVDQWVTSTSGPAEMLYGAVHRLHGAVTLQANDCKVATSLLWMNSGCLHDGSCIVVHQYFLNHD